MRAFSDTPTCYALLKTNLNRVQVSQVELGKATRQLSLGKPNTSRGGRPPSGSVPSSPRARGSRLGSGNIPGSPSRSRSNSVTTNDSVPRSPGGRSRTHQTGLDGAPKSPSRAKNRPLLRTGSAGSCTTAVLSPRTSSGSVGGSFWGRSSGGGSHGSSAGNVSPTSSRSSGRGAGLSITVRQRNSSSSTSGPPPSPSGPVGGNGFERAKSRMTKLTRATSSGPIMSSGKGSSGGSLRAPQLILPHSSHERRGRTSEFSASPRGRSSSLRLRGVAGGSGRTSNSSVNNGRRSVSGSVRPSSAISRGEERAVSPRVDAALMKRPRFSDS